MGINTGAGAVGGGRGGPESRGDRGGSSRTGSSSGSNGKSSLPPTKKQDLGALSNITGQQPLGASAATVEGPTTSYGAPIHTNDNGTFARSPDAWSALSDQVDKYNQAARAWNGGTSRSLANFINGLEPMGFSMQAPELGKPKTYVGGAYHFGVNPAALAGGLLGGASMIPGAGTLLGAAAGKAYEVAGAPNVMLGGGDVPGGWRSDLGAPEAPDFSHPAPRTPAGRPTEGGPGLLPQIAGNPSASAVTPNGPPPVQTPPVSGSSLPPISTPAAWQQIPGPTPYGWARPSWNY